MNQSIDLQLALEVGVEAERVWTDSFFGFGVDTPGLVETGGSANLFDCRFPEFFELGLLVGDTGEGFDDGDDGVVLVGEVFFENLLPEFHGGAVVIPVGFAIG